MEMGYYFFIAGLIGMYIPVCLGVQWLRGYTRNALPFSLVGHVSIGAYASALFPESYGLLGLLIGCGVSIVLSCIVRYITKSQNNTITTLVHFIISLGCYATIIFFNKQTGGFQGIMFTQTERYFPWIFAGISALLYGSMIRYGDYSHQGKRLQAMRDNPSAMEIVGMNTQYAILINTIIGGILGIVSGYMYIHTVGFVDPKIAGTYSMIIIITSIMISGIRPIYGTPFGVALLLVIIEVLRILIVDPQYTGPVNVFIVGFILLLIVLYFPSGIFGKISSTKE